ncbi:uncharacterized protein LOC121370874 [Gigantopelta aegis]|uniref:uncharacterized protein LOC121370874 n=1 Tax=Gigantopelta aegis TaxID=1735272 RepID=UPI001B88D739|nr:uncharacterized protein LOC121370874 [Gigantopelta aegis]
MASSHVDHSFPVVKWRKNVTNNHEHLWKNIDIPKECPIPEGCLKSDRLKKCIACNIVAPRDRDIQLVNCKPTFQWKEGTRMEHHWMTLQTPNKANCTECLKSCKPGTDKSEGVICSWCKDVYHKNMCLTQEKKDGQCSLGVLANVIIPPSWIIKNSSGDEPSFYIKPIYSFSSKPVLVFLDRGSGKYKDSDLYEGFYWFLNPRQVIDIDNYTKSELSNWLKLYRNVRKLRILVCGDDDTVNLVFRLLEKINWRPNPPVAVLPMGMCNSVARTMNWDGDYKCESVSQILTDVEFGLVVKYDRWKVESVPNKVNPERILSSDAQKSLPVDEFSNYFSIGADASAAYRFQKEGKQVCSKDRKTFYSTKEGRNFLKESAKELAEHVQFEYQYKDLTNELKKSQPQCLVFSNTSSYLGEAFAFEKNPSSQVTQNYDDGIIEAFGLQYTSKTLGQISKKQVIYQHGQQMKLTTSKKMPVLVDGELCVLAPSIITVLFKDQYNMVMKSSKTDKPKTKKQTIQLWCISSDKVKSKGLDNIDVLVDADPLDTIVVPCGTKLSEVRKTILSQPIIEKTLGVSLEDLVKRAPEGCRVPYIVKYICSFLVKSGGLEQEGMFRLTGKVANVKIIMSSFDQHGDIEFDNTFTNNEIASTLKKFLREMPVTVIPQNETEAFISVYETSNTENNARLVEELKKMVDDLPQMNYDLLKFIIKVLLLLVAHIDTALMSSDALAVVFVPNVLYGLQEQTLDLTVYDSIEIKRSLFAIFIDEYDKIFKSKGEESPVIEWKRNAELDKTEEDGATSCERPVDSFELPKFRPVSWCFVDSMASEGVTPIKTEDEDLYSIENVCLKDLYIMHTYVNSIPEKPRNARAEIVLNRPVAPDLLKDYADKPEINNEWNELNQLDGNKIKNKNLNFIPVEQSRVKLGVNSHYINASFIDGVKEREYIATPTPLINMFTDFWRMIWMYKCKVIVMLLDQKEIPRNAEEYWPQSESQYGDITVTMVESTFYHDVLIRTFEIKQEDERRLVRQYAIFDLDKECTVKHFKIIHLVEIVSRENPSSPIVVHCSDGCGRTGVFIALSYLYKYKSSTYDVFGYVVKMRKSRLIMVTSLEQYIYIYKTLNIINENKKIHQRDDEEANAEDTVVTENKRPIGMNRFKDHIVDLYQRCSGQTYNKFTKEWNDLMRVTQIYAFSNSATLKCNKTKNRDELILPYEHSRVKLLSGESDYINASFIDGTIKKQYIATQGPTRGWVKDFWMMICENKCSLIVDMAETKLHDEVPYCPSKIQVRSAKTYGDNITVTFLGLTEETNAYMNVRKYSVTWPSKNGKEVRFVEQHSLIPDLNIHHPQNQNIINFVARTQAKWAGFKWSMREKCGPLVVLCSDGSHGTGVYIALDYLQQMVNQNSMDQTIDVFGFILKMRNNRTQMVSNLNQYTFIHDMVKIMIENKEKETSSSGASGH